MGVISLSILPPHVFLLVHLVLLHPFNELNLDSVEVPTDCFSRKLITGFIFTVFLGTRDFRPWVKFLVSTLCIKVSVFFCCEIRVFCYYLFSFVIFSIKYIYLLAI